MAIIVLVRSPSETSFALAYTLTSTEDTPAGIITVLSKTKSVPLSLVRVTVISVLSVLFLVTFNTMPSATPSNMVGCEVVNDNDGPSSSSILKDFVTCPPLVAVAEQLHEGR